MTEITLRFVQRLSYRQYQDVAFEIQLSRPPAGDTPVLVKLDTGSDYCVFHRLHAERMGLTVESGTLQRFRTAAGSFNAYGHEVTLALGNLEWEATVFFAEPDNFPINVVGRIGFLDHLQIGLVDYEQQLYLSPYEP